MRIFGFLDQKRSKTIQILSQNFDCYRVIKVFILEVPRAFSVVTVVPSILVRRAHEAAHVDAYDGRKRPHKRYVTRRDRVDQILVALDPLWVDRLARWRGTANWRPLLVDAERDDVDHQKNNRQHGRDGQAIGVARIFDDTPTARVEKVED